MLIINNSMLPTEMQDTRSMSMLGYHRQTSWSKRNMRLRSYCKLKLYWMLGWSWMSSVVTANLSSVDHSDGLTYIYTTHNGMGGGPVPRGEWIPFTMVKVYYWSMSDGGMSHCHMSDTARKVTVVCSRLQKLRAYQYKPTAGWRYTVWMWPTLKTRVLGQHAKLSVLF